MVGFDPKESPASCFRMAAYPRIADISYVIYEHVAYKKMPYGMLVSLERNKNSVA